MLCPAAGAAVVIGTRAVTSSGHPGGKCDMHLVLRRGDGPAGTLQHDCYRRRCAWIGVCSAAAAAAAGIAAAVAAAAVVPAAAAAAVPAAGMAASAAVVAAAAAAAVADAGIAASAAAVPAHAEHNFLLRRWLSEKTHVANPAQVSAN